MNIKAYLSFGLLGFVCIGLIATGASNKQASIERNVTKPMLSKQIVTTNQPEKTFKVQNLTLNPKQVVFLNTEVTGQSVEMVIARIAELNRDNNNDIYLLLSSPGGSVFDGGRLISYMEASKNKVNTVCYDFCASMAAQIHAHGAKRYSIDRSTLMYHQASGGVTGSLKEMKSRLGYMDLEIAKLDAYIADRAGIDRNAFDKMVEHEAWVAGDTAVSLGLSDGLVIVNLTTASEPVFTTSDEFKRLNIKLDSTINITNPLKEIQ